MVKASDCHAGGPGFNPHSNFFCFIFTYLKLVECVPYNVPNLLSKRTWKRSATEKTLALRSCGPRFDSWLKPLLQKDLLRGYSCSLLRQRPYLTWIFYSSLLTQTRIFYSSLLTQTRIFYSSVLTQSSTLPLQNSTRLSSRLILLS